MNYCPFNTIGCREMVLDGAMEIVFGQMASVSQAQVFIFCLFWLSPKHKSQESQRHHHLLAPPHAPPYLDLIQNAAFLLSSWASLGLVAPLLMSQLMILSHGV